MESQSTRKASAQCLKGRCAIGGIQFIAICKLQIPSKSQRKGIIGLCRSGPRAESMCDCEKNIKRAIEAGVDAHASIEERLSGSLGVYYKMARGLYELRLKSALSEEQPSSAASQ